MNTEGWVQLATPVLGWFLTAGVKKIPMLGASLPPRAKLLIAIGLGVLANQLLGVAFNVDSSLIEAAGLAGSATWLHQMGTVKPKEETK